MNIMLSAIQLDFIYRIGVAILCGVLIGFERQWLNRIIGMQTTILVAVGSCLFVMSSDYISPTGSPEAAGRIVGQIVSGIGFLGAGMIFKDGFRAYGMNSAANIWAVAAIGSLIGLHKVDLALISVVMLLSINLIFNVVDNKVGSFRKKYDLRINNNYQIDIMLKVDNYSEEFRSAVLDIITKNTVVRIYSVKTKYENKDTLKLSLFITTHDLEYKWITALVKEISVLNDKTIVDWSQVK